VEEQYEILKMVMDGRLHISPFSRAHPPRKVLDIATGTGTWAIEMGDMYPEAEIIGTDLSPIQPAFVPPNVRFFIEDSCVFLPARVVVCKLTYHDIGLMTGMAFMDGLVSWGFAETIISLQTADINESKQEGLTRDRDYPADFDFIHTRVTIGCWSDMKKQIIQRAFDHLQPGGWLECQEVPAIIACDDGTMSDDYGWQRWARELGAVGRLADRQVNVGPELKDWMREVGFVDIHETIFKIPVNGWPKEMRLKHVGMMWQRNLLEGLSGFSLGMFHRFMGKSVEEIEASVSARPGCEVTNTGH
jgi:metalloendopeptidase OMA1, mitochondrial